MVNSISWRSLPEIRQRSRTWQAVAKIKVVTTTDLGLQYIAMNLRRPPFDDTVIPRRAVHRDPSRRVMAAAAWNGFRRTRRFLHLHRAAVLGMRTTVCLEGGDLAKAKQLLAARATRCRVASMHSPCRATCEEITSG